MVVCLSLSCCPVQAVPTGSALVQEVLPASYRIHDFIINYERQEASERNQSKQKKKKSFENLAKLLWMRAAQTKGNDITD
jgi:hypothetical protein